jgi:SAM-dependent methyltransferase
LAHADLYDELLLGEVMRGFHGGAWYNVGLWRDATDPQAACAALVARVAAAVVGTPARVLDVGCGIGGSTAALAACWPDAALTGIGISERQLARARATCPDARFIHADAVATPFGDAAFDAVIAIESALHFDARALFFAEARRLLAPGGTLALADLLAPSAAWPGAWSVPAANLGWTADRYAHELERAGFIDVAVSDVTADTWMRYIDSFSAHVADLPDDDMAWRASARALREGEQPVYVVASACAPRG